MKTTWKMALVAIGAKISLVAAVAFLGLGSKDASAQQKFGYINMQELISSMPENTAAQTQIETLGKDLNAQFETMRNEYFTKTQELMQGGTTMLESIRKQKEKELQDIQARIQEFQQSAQEELSAKERELLEPILDKAQNAINKVSKELGLVFVSSLTTGALAYHSEELMIDVLPLVRKELGIAQ